MSFSISGALIGTAVSAVATTGLEDVLIAFRAQRGIQAQTDFIVPNVTMEEIGHDELHITEHPVELGAAITDHSFSRPAEVTLRYGWSNSSQDIAIVNSLVSGGGGFFPSETYINTIYDRLLAVQASRLVFTIYTGKRQYDNMLLASLTQVTDPKWEYALQVTAHCKQIIIVSTSAANIGPQLANVKSPENNSPLTPAGINSVQAVQPATQSALTAATAPFPGF